MSEMRAAITARDSTSHVSFGRSGIWSGFNARARVNWFSSWSAPGTFSRIDPFDLMTFVIAAVVSATSVGSFQLMWNCSITVRKPLRSRSCSVARVNSWRLVSTAAVAAFACSGVMDAGSMPPSSSCFFASISSSSSFCGRSDCTSSSLRPKSLRSRYVREASITSCRMDGSTEVSASPASSSWARISPTRRRMSTMSRFARDAARSAWSMVSVFFMEECWAISTSFSAFVKANIWPSAPAIDSTMDA